MIKVCELVGTTMATPETDIHLYWATGCTSCLRIKEFFERNGTPVRFAQRGQTGL